MAATAPYAGYLGQVWRTAYASLTWLSGIMAANSNAPLAVGAPALLVYQTLRNAVDAVSAFSTANAWVAELAAIRAVQVLPLSLDPTTTVYFNNRIAAYQAAQFALHSILPPAVAINAASLLAANKPAIADPGLLAFYMTFGYETPPALATMTDVINGAVAEATAWNTVTQLISVYQGTQFTQAYDAAARQYDVAQRAANTLLAFSDLPNAVSSNLSLTWNTIVTMPAMTANAAIFTSAPYSNVNQQSGVIRYALINAANSLAYLLLSLRQPAIGVSNLATLLNSDSLLDFAARQTGDFENWTGIASANGLLPPWTGPNAAPYGSQLQIPAPGSPPPTPGVALPTYAANVLGTDIYIGPINGVMPAWNGDYQLVTGYSNLAISLGRRLQTTLGSLIYHTDFGSRIPPEVGNVQDQSTAGHIAAYGLSALNSDPRVGSVQSATATIQPNGLGFVDFNAVVQPIGQPNTGVSVNEVISAPA